MDGIKCFSTEGPRTAVIDSPGWSVSSHCIHFVSLSTMLVLVQRHACSCILTGRLSQSVSLLSITWKSQSTGYNFSVSDGYSIVWNALLSPHSQVFLYYGIGIFNFCMFKFPAFFFHALSIRWILVKQKCSWREHSNLHRLTSNHFFTPEQE